MNPEKPGTALEDLVIGACHLAASGADVRAVHVVTDRRLGYQKLLCCRAQAEASGLTMTVLGGGGVVLRPRASTPPLRFKPGKRITSPDGLAN